eukprot:Gb_09871 [translate_table: standard]
MTLVFLSNQGLISRSSKHASSLGKNDRLAIEYIVIPRGQPVELLPRCSEIIARQIELVKSYQLVTEKAGTDLNSRLQILPLHANNKEIQSSDLSPTQGKVRPSADVDSSSFIAGTSVARLPVLPE